MLLVKFYSFYAGSGFYLLNLRGDFIAWVWISTLEHTAQEKERGRLQNDSEFISDGRRKSWMNAKPSGEG